MEFAVIVSTKDPAGVNIKEALMRLYDFKEAGEEFECHKVYGLNNIKLYTTDTDSINCEDIDKKIGADLFIFATKHQSRSGIPSLSVHSTGNWSEDNSYGGQAKKLCTAPSSYLKHALIFLEENNKTGFEVVQECTHHGPYIEKPIMFIEIGSSEKQWKDKGAAEIIAAAIVYVTMLDIPFCKVAFGIGGLHTTPNFKKIMLNSDVALGHICPKYMLENLDEDMVVQAIKNNHPSNAEIVILDWKGLGTEKERIVKLLESLNINFTRTSEF